jgi:hypothetical protein
MEVEAEKTKYKFLSRHQKVGQNHDITRIVAGNSSENVAQFKYPVKQQQIRI